jgi:hypothetical protein
MLKGSGRLMLPNFFVSRGSGKRENDNPTTNHHYPNDRQHTTNHTSSTTSGNARVKVKKATLGATLAQIHREQQQQQKNKLSQNAAFALYAGRRREDDENDDDDEDDNALTGRDHGYALELDDYDNESVSSLNDSCFGGASVTGGYNVYSSTTDLTMRSPMKQAMSLAVGVVPTLTDINNTTPSVASSTTDDVSYLIHDIERPSVQQLFPPPPPLHETQQQQQQQIDEEDNSMFNHKNGRLRTMIPILKGTISPKKQKRKTQQHRRAPDANESNTNNNTTKKILVDDPTKLCIIPSSTTTTESTINRSGSNHKVSISSSSTTPASINLNSITSCESYTEPNPTTSTTYSTTEHPIVEMNGSPKVLGTHTNNIPQHRTSKCRRFYKACISHCYPFWLQRAPKWIQMIVLLCWIVVLLMVLIAITGGIVSVVRSQQAKHQSDDNNDPSSVVWDPNHNSNDTIRVAVPPSNPPTTVTEDPPSSSSSTFVPAPVPTTNTNNNRPEPKIEATQTPNRR